MLEDSLRQGAFSKRRRPGQHVKERATQRVNIAADVGGPAVAGLLGRQVIDRAHGGAVASQAKLVVAGLASQTQVNELGDCPPPGRAKENIRRLDITVNHATLVSVVQ